MIRLARCYLVAALALVAQVAIGYDFQGTLNKTSGVDFDSRCYPAQLIQAFPTININSGDALPAEHWRFYIAAGDKNVKASRVCGDVAPTWSITGTRTSNDSLVTTDLNDPTYSISAGVTGTNTMNAIGDNSVGSAVSVARTWVVNAGVVAGEAIPQGATAYFVVPNGDDSKDGKTIATAWGSTAKVSGFTFPAGADVYFKAGGTWTTQLDILLSGVSPSNPATLGSFYCSDSNLCGVGATPIVNAPTNNTTLYVRPRDFTYTYPRAIFRGSYATACRKWREFWPFLPNYGAPDAKKCAWGSDQPAPYINLPSGMGPQVPPGKYASMVNVRIPLTAHDVTVQDIEIKDSAGTGFTAQNAVPYQCVGATDVNCAFTHLIIQRTRLNSSATAGYSLNGMNQLVFRQNEVSQTNLASSDEEVGHNACTSTAVVNGAPVCDPVFPKTLYFTAASAIDVANCSHCQMLYEQNDLHDGGQQQGFGGFKSATFLARGNELYSNYGSDFGQGADVIFEQNMSAESSGPYDPSQAGAEPYRGKANSQVVGMEFLTCSACAVTPVANPASGLVPGERLMVRNNLGSQNRPLPAGASDNMQCMKIYTEVNSLTRNFTVWWLGNTCLTPVAFNDSIAHNDAATVVANNLFGLTNSVFPKGCDIFKTPPAPGPVITFDANHNHWKLTPTNTTCKGTGDVYNSNLGLTSSFDFSTVHYNDGTGARHIPTADDFITAIGAPGDNDGIVMTATSNSTIIRTDTTWDWVLSMRHWLPQCNTTGAQVPKSEWIKQLATDFCGNPRGSTPTMGGRNAE